MHIREVNEKEKEKFNKSADHPLQSWEWGEFRKEWGNKVIRLGVFNGDTITEALQVIFSKIPETKLTIGTVIRGPGPTVEILRELERVGKKENAVFIKLEPNVVMSVNSEKQPVESGDDSSEKLLNTMRNYGLVSGKNLFTPTTFWIDLAPSEDALMKSFLSKTRYNIRLAEKKGVEVVEDNSDFAFERYLDLMRETVERQGFYAHTEKYHRLMWKHLHCIPSNKNNPPIARLLTARYKREIITAWIVFVWNDFLYYPYGASSSDIKYRNLMANNLMMWEAIRFGQYLKLKTFDLWGREEGKGFTKFKEGYNPKVVEFAGTWDLPTNSLYYPYRYAEALRWKALRFKSMFSKPKF
jgi:lipid II:glycine glycyltransferase (peptidoglycan interpeptide bridge formation enzyme)